MTRHHRNALAGLLGVFALCVGMSGAGAQAAPVAIANPGFEDLYFGSNLPGVYNGDVPAGAFPVGPPPPGWIAYHSGGAAEANAFIGVLNPGRVIDDGPMATFFPGGAPEGDNAVLLYFGQPTGGAAYGVRQTLAATLQPHTHYTLNVEVGNIGSGTGFVEPFLGFGPFFIEGFPGYRVELRAGGMLLARDDDTLLPGEGEWATSTVEFVTASGHPQLDANLEIWLISLNQGTLVPGQSGVEVDFDDVRLDASPAAVATPMPAFALGLVAVAVVASARALRRTPPR